MKLYLHDIFLSVKAYRIYKKRSLLTTSFEVNRINRVLITISFRSPYNIP